MMDDFAATQQEWIDEIARRIEGLYRCAPDTPCDDIAEAFLSSMLFRFPTWKWRPVESELVDARADLVRTLKRLERRAFRDPEARSETAVREMAKALGMGKAADGLFKFRWKGRAPVRPRDAAGAETTREDAKPVH